MWGMTWFLRTLSWHRRKVAAVLAALGALAMMSHFSGATEPVASVVTLTRGISAGTVIESDDVSLREVPQSLIPAGALTELADALGHSAAASLTSSTVLQSGLLVAGEPPNPGRSLVPITVRDPQLREILSAGLRIALVSAVGDVPGILTEDALVHTLPQVAATSMVTSGQSTLVLVDVPTALAPAVSMLGQAGQISIFIIG